MYAYKPQIIDETPGTKYYCTCGNSANKPYCDGSHRGSGRSPAVVEITSPKRLAICDCGSSATHPFCDGTHARKKQTSHTCCGGHCH